MVKNSRKYASTGSWGFAQFDDGKPADEAVHNTCFSCHEILAAAGLAQYDELSGFTGYVQDSGEGRWTLLAAIEEAIPAEVLSAALNARFRSRQGEHTFAEKLLSAMGKGFGGHLEPEHGG